MIAVGLELLRLSGLQVCTSIKFPSLCLACEEGSDSAYKYEHCQMIPCDLSYVRGRKDSSSPIIRVIGEISHEPARVGFRESCVDSQKSEERKVLTCLQASRTEISLCPAVAGFL